MYRRCFACDLPYSYHDFWYLNRDAVSGFIIEGQQLCRRCYEIIFRYPVRRKYATKKEAFAAISRSKKGRPSPRKGKRLAYERSCYACGSNTTYTNPKTGKRSWLANYGQKRNLIGYLCNTCNSKYVSNPKTKGLNFHITFKDKRIKLDYDPKTGFCSECGKAAKTHMHHDKYDESDPLAHTRELCESCHGKDSAQRRYEKKNLFI